MAGPMRLSTRIGGEKPRYVHLAASRRLGGAAVEIDLNPDASCNWRCVYCDVPDLRDAKGPRVDVEALEGELRSLLDAAHDPAYLAENAPEGARTLRGTAISGRGEPTLSFHFAPAVEVLERVLAESGAAQLALAVVTNGSNVNNRKVREGLERVASMGGEVWFKFDAATRERVRQLNHADQILRATRENMRVSAHLCPTWLQTCVFELDGEPSLNEREQGEYLAFLRLQLRGNVPLCGVQLYTTSRPSRQPEAASVAPASKTWVDGLAERIRELGLEVRVHV